VAAPAEYVTDVPYVRAFEPDLSPSRLRLVAALNGFAPPPADDFDYCELGSAHGDTTTTLAASYPRARFVGVDINPDHIASANRLAARGDVGNVRFVLEDFEALGRRDLPTFDYVTAHGVLSWVSPEKRRALIDFAAQKLAPGGLLHVSYNALPGWAAVEPLRQLIAGRAALAEGNSVARAREGVELAEHMRRLGAEYFRANPSATAMLDRMQRLGLAYVAHEYLHAHWVPMYFAQLAAEMAAAGLHFVGQLPLYLNYRDLAVPEALKALFSSAGGAMDRIAFESLKDFALNEYFRRDVFMKAPRARSDGATRAYLDTTPFGVRLEGGPLPTEARFPHHTLEFAGPVFAGLRPALGRGAATVGDLARCADLDGFELPRVRDAVMKLAIAEAIIPMQHATSSALAPPDALYRLPLLANAAALREGLTCDAPIALASTAAGTGLELSPVEALALFVLTEVAAPLRASWLEERCARTSFRMTVRGRSVEGRGEQARVLRGELDLFARERLPRLVEIGIVERA
jgi:trans-aconitate methyltransferase